MSASAKGLEPSRESELLKPYVPRLLIDWLRTGADERRRAVVGTLAFVDISGFTKLTERLARSGKIGAEEINDTLDACFTELLSVAYDHGAGVIKWGGDAVLLLFDGEEHAPRACLAAARMQQTIRRIGRLRTSAGRVTLRMSVGIHSGSFDFFLVGDLHRELVIAGPAATRTVAMEQLAEAGQIAVSDSTAAALDPRLLGVRKGDAILLRGRPNVPVDRASEAPDTTGLDLAGCLPITIREHLLAGGRDAEHRPITVAFIEFSGTDELYEQEGPDALAAAIDDCIRRVQYAAFQHQIAFFETDISLGGGKILLLAGAPRSSENDAERMLRTLRTIVDAPGRLPLRIGVNSGRVFCGDFGPPYRRTYSIKGDAVNLAARLMVKAEPGQILATKIVLAGSKTEFETAGLEPFVVKGKAQPVQAYAVGRLGGARRSRQSATPLVGRDCELDSILEAVGAARAWEGRLVELSGEPGMGKSRLLQEVHERSEGVLSLTVACEEYEASTPYFPFRSLLRTLLGAPNADRAELERELRERVAEVAPHLLPWLPLIAILLGLELPATPEVEQLEEQFRKERLHEVVRELLGVVLATPTLLVFEDVHWLDDASRDLLAALLEGLEYRPWTLVVTHRGGETALPAPAARTRRIHLEPLSDADAAAFVEATTEAVPLTPHAVAALANRSGGNPLFLTELAAATREAGSTEELPDSVESLLAAQIDRLTPPDRRLLRTASVVGSTFRAELLAAVLEAEAFDAAVWRRLDGFVARDAGGTLRFRHALVRDAAYEGLPYRRRRELHARIGETIERLAEDPADDAELLSLHFFHAQRFAEAWRYSQLAGERAMAIYANVAAAEFFTRALDSAAKLATIPTREIAAISEALGDVRLRLGEFEGAVMAYRSARRHADSGRAEEAKLVLKEARIPFRQGRYPQALRWLKRALLLLDDATDADATAERARLYAWLGAIRLRQGRHLETIDWCRKAIAEAAAVDARPALAHAYFLLDYALVGLGRYDEAVHSSRALAIYEELGDLGEQGGVLNNMGMFAYYQGRWEEALDYYRRAEEAWERAGNRWTASLATMNIAEILSDQGRLDEAEPLLKAALRVTKASRSASRIAEISSYYGRLAARAGRFEEAQALLLEARLQYEHDGARSELLFTDARLTEALVLQGEAAPALASAEDALRRAGSVEGSFQAIPMLQRVRGSALIQLGRLEEAGNALRESIEAARKRGADYEVALALDALATLCRLTGEPTAAFETERRDIFERLGVVAVPEIPVAGAAGASPATPAELAQPA